MEENLEPTNGDGLDGAGALSLIHIFTTTGVVGLDPEGWVVQPTPPSPSNTDSSTAYPVFQPRLMTTSPSAAKSRP